MVCKTNNFKQQIMKNYFCLFVGETIKWCTIFSYAKHTYINKSHVYKIKGYKQLTLYYLNYINVYLFYRYRNFLLSLFLT